MLIVVLYNRILILNDTESLDDINLLTPFKDLAE